MLPLVFSGQLAVQTKFIVAMSALVCGFVLALFDKLTGDFAFIASVAVGAYSAANWAITSAHIRANGNGKGEAHAVPK